MIGVLKIPAHPHADSLFRDLAFFLHMKSARHGS